MSRNTYVYKDMTNILNTSTESAGSFTDTESMEDWMKTVVRHTAYSLERATWNKEA